MSGRNAAREAAARMALAGFMLICASGALGLTFPHRGLWVSLLAGFVLFIVGVMAMTIFDRGDGDDR